MKDDSVVTMNYGDDACYSTSTSEWVDLYKGNSVALLIPLLKLASQRLLIGGRLAFWLPTRPNVSKEEVVNLLAKLCADVAVAVDNDCAVGYSNNNGNDDITNNDAVSQQLKYLQLQRVTPDGQYGSSLWRWLCVYQLKQRI